MKIEVGGNSISDMKMTRELKGNLENPLRTLYKPLVEIMKTK